MMRPGWCRSPGTLDAAACRRGHRVHLDRADPLGPAGRGGRAPVRRSALDRRARSRPSTSTARSRAAATGGCSAARPRGRRRSSRRLAHATPHGFGNFRFCTIAECGPNIPFFPSAYHGGGPPRFTIGLAGRRRRRGKRSRARLAGRPGAAARRDARGAAFSEVEACARALAAEHGIAYGGTDLTPAPFPEDADSSAGMLEDLGVEASGGAPGPWRRRRADARCSSDCRSTQVGYSGLMLPVLEDSLLAARASEGLLSVSELLLYSAVCGTGLDTGAAAGGRRRPTSLARWCWTSRRWPGAAGSR